MADRRVAEASTSTADDAYAAAADDIVVDRSDCRANICARGFQRRTRVCLQVTATSELGAIIVLNDFVLHFPLLSSGRTGAAAKNAEARTEWMI